VMENWSARSERWISNIPHPRSPAGRGFDWSSIGLPHPLSRAGWVFDWLHHGLRHPDSPAGRNTSLNEHVSRLQGAHPEEEGLKQTCDDVEKFLEECSSKLRAALPDESLRTLYDYRIVSLERAYSSAKVSSTADDAVASLLHRLENQIDWFRAKMQPTPDSGLDVGAGPSIAKARSAWEYGTLDDKQAQLKEIEDLGVRFYDAATKKIQEQWVEAERQGGGKELIERWRLRLLQDLAVSRFKSTEAEQTGSGTRETRLTKRSWFSVTVVELVSGAEKVVEGLTVNCHLPGLGPTSGTMSDSSPHLRYDDLVPGGQGDVLGTSHDEVAWEVSTDIK
jgi:hypothetical protein